MSLRELAEKARVFEPVMEKKDCKMKVLGAEKHNWKPKEGTGVTEETPAMKLQLQIDDEGAVCENSDAMPSLNINDFINLAPHPYVSKSGEVAKLRTGKLFQLQRALGFEPLYIGEGGEPVEPKVSKTGKKYCPAGASEKLNPDFIEAYFDEQDEPRFDAWIGRDIVAHVVVRKSEEYGNSNEVKSYVAKQD